MSGSARQARSVARLAAVQALYQMETAGAGREAAAGRQTRVGQEVDILDIGPERV